MSDSDGSLPPAPYEYDSDEIEHRRGIAHVRITGEITSSDMDTNGRSQPVWSWTKQCIMPNGDQEVAAFWQIVRFFVEEKGFSKEEMAEFLESTAAALRREIDSE